MVQTLKNDLLTVVIDSLGAELQSIIDNRTGYQYLYQGNTKFWGRRSPVLFPIVGAVWNGKYLMDGKEYHLGQHGFARDCEFSIMDCEAEDEVWFSLEYDSNTLSAYPRKFRLEIGYNLNGERLTVMWRVINLDNREMDFHIGGHPAFNYPDFKPSDEVHAYLIFDRDPETTELVEEKGCMSFKEQKIVLDKEGMIPIVANTFDIDTIVVGKSRVGRVSMLDKNRNPYLSLFFKAPVVGIWSPSPEAPFVCIEPWYGRADKVGFSNEFKEREYTNHLKPGEIFEASYIITFDNL